MGKSSSASTDWVDESRMGKREKQQCCALIERSRDKISPGEDVRSPVWNFLGETKAFSLTFYAKK